MIIPNIINVEKRGKIEGSTFHVFYLDVTTAVLFDKFMDVPIIYGKKIIVNSVIKNFSEHLPPTTKKIRIFFYKNAPPEFKMKMKYEGTTDKIIVPNF
jgi:hypothetical protein